MSVSATQGGLNQKKWDIFLPTVAMVLLPWWPITTAWIAVCRPIRRYC